MHFSSSLYGDGNDQIIMSLQCSGSETSLLLCPSNGYLRLEGSRRCGAGHSAAVRCYHSG